MGKVIAMIMCLFLSTSFLIAQENYQLVEDLAYYTQEIQDSDVYINDRCTAEL